MARHNWPARPFSFFPAPLPWNWYKFKPKEQQINPTNSYGEIFTRVKHEDIAFVEALGFDGDLGDADVGASLQVQQARSEGLRLDVVEARLDTSLQQADASGLLEVGQKERGFEAAHFAVLHGGLVQEVIQLHGLVGRSSGFILRGGLSKPEVDIPAQCLELLALVILLFVGVQADVGVILVEVAHRGLRFLHFEFLNAPDLQTGLLASVLPGRLAGSSGLAALLVEVRAQTSDVGVLNLEDLFLLHRLTKELSRAGGGEK